MKSLKALAKVTKGKLEIKQREKFIQAIENLPDADYCLILEKLYRRRSSQQNRAKFGIAYKILSECFTDAMGEYFSIDDVHEYCKVNLMPAEYVERLKQEHSERCEVVNKETGDIINLPFVLTTTKMSTIEEITYYQNMQRFAAEFFGADIPNPNE